MSHPTDKSSLSTLNMSFTLQLCFSAAGFNIPIVDCCATSEGTGKSVFYNHHCWSTGSHESIVCMGQLRLSLQESRKCFCSH